jgi:glycosyltransferase involved in cell wall biosynthesis
MYINTISELISNNKNVFHLIAGHGNIDNLYNKLKENNCENRIMHLGVIKNLKPFYKLIDIYLASFPFPGASCELEAMALCRPVVSMANDNDSHLNSGAWLVGLSECIAEKNNTQQYYDITYKLITDKKFRSETGINLAQRFNKYFSPEIRIDLLEKLYNP